MVSALYKACAVGDVAQVIELLKDASSVEIEVKDHTGITPLIQAVRHNHVEIVKILLDSGADPHNASSQGRPETYSTDPAILELLTAAASKSAQPQQQQAPVPQAAPQQQQQQPVQQPVPQPAPPMPYGVMPYPGHEGAYPYYPPPHMPYGAQPYPAYSHDGTVVNGHPPPMQYYHMPPPPPPPPQMSPPQQTPPHTAQQSADGAVQTNGATSGGHHNNLPPPHVARAIPCRYYPACKYGSSCMFQHPQTPYFSGPMPPPAQYPQPQPYDPMSPQAAYPPQVYYPPPGVYPPPAAHPTSPPQHVQHIPGHSRGPSEIVVSPIAVAQPLPPPGMVPYGIPAQMSPYAVQPALPPIAILPGAPPTMASPAVYPGSVPMIPAPLPPMSPYHTRRDSISSYHPGPDFGSPHADPNGLPTSPRQGQTNMDGLGFMSAPLHARDGSGHRSRGARASIGGGRGKPACLFFPSGRCRNGDQCRFPHVMPDGPPVAAPSRAGKPRASMGSIESKFSNMSIRDEPNGHVNGYKPNGTHENGRGSFGSRNAAGRKSPPKPQRVPVAEDFPVLSGSKTPPTQNGHVNGNGLTAADVVRAAANMVTPQKEQTRPAVVTPEPVKTSVNGDVTTMIPVTLVPTVLETVPEVPVTA